MLGSCLEVYGWSLVIWGWSVLPLRIMKLALKLVVKLFDLWVTVLLVVFVDSCVLCNILKFNCR